MNNDCLKHVLFLFVTYYFITFFMQSMEIEENPQAIERGSKRVLRRTKKGVKHGRGVTVGCNSVHNMPKHQNNTRHL